MIYLIIAATILILIWILISFNLLVRDRNRIKEAWSGIDVQLKRRHSLIPNLTEAVKAYGAYEKKLFEEITRKRSESLESNQVSQKAIYETDISSLLKNIVLVAEAYPDLKASRNFLEFQQQLIEIEDQLQYARRYYNGAVRNYNIRVESFPGNMIAGIFNFKPSDYFEIKFATEKLSPKVKL